MLFPIIWPLRNLCVAGNNCPRNRDESKRLISAEKTRDNKFKTGSGKGGGVLIPRSRFFLKRIPNLVLFSWLSRVPVFVSQQRQFLQKVIKCNLYIDPFHWYFQFARVLKVMNFHTSVWWKRVMRYDNFLGRCDSCAQCPWYKNFSGTVSTAPSSWVALAHWLTGVRIELWQLITDITHWTRFFD